MNIDNTIGVNEVDWKSTTPHKYYECDRGSLALRINGAVILLENGYGDCRRPVYFETCDMPETFKFSGTAIDGPAKVEVMAYDCSSRGEYCLPEYRNYGGDPLKTYDLKEEEMLFIYRDNEASFAFEKHNRKGE